MAKYTTPRDLWDIVTALQSVGGTQYEGNSIVNDTLRFVKPEQGIDVEYKNRFYGDGVNEDGLEQLDPQPLSIREQSGDVVEDRDKRKSLGTFPISNRGFWEDINFNTSTLQPYLTSELRKTVKTRIVPIADSDGKMVYKDISSGQTDREYSIDALVFVTDPNNDDEIIRLDRYYDKELNKNEYGLATEGKIKYYIYPRTSGRYSPDFPLDVYKSRGRKVVTAEGISHQFDRVAASDKLNKNRGYFLFNLDWGDNTEKEYTNKPKLLESSVIFDHTYEKPGFYTITGTVFQSNGFHITQYERFETRIFLNPSKKYIDNLNLLKDRNFAMIGGITPSSTLVKSVSSTLGIDPFDFSQKKTKNILLEKYNELDAIELLNFMNMIDSNSVTSYSERYINPYSKTIDDEPTPVLEIPQILGCMDTNADNYVEFATINNGCKYSYLITGNINGLGGQQPLFFLGEYDGFRDYYLAGNAYADWNEIITEISSNDITSNKFALIVAPSSIYPELGSSDDVPFDGWTIPDGLRIGKINYSDEGTPIIEQTSGNDLPDTLSGQGFGYKVYTPIDLYSDVDGGDRVYILTADPDNPPSETNYTDKEISVNWSGDVEDTGDLSSGLGQTIFYATIDTEVLSGDGTITYLENLAYGQDGVVAGDTIKFAITPSVNQNINHLYYNDEEVLPGDSRIIEAFNLSTNTNMPANEFYGTFDGLPTWAEDVRYTLELVAETNNRVEAMFSVMSVSDEVFGDNYVTYDTVAVAVFNSPNTLRTGPSGVRFEPSIGLDLVQAGQGVPSTSQGEYHYNYQVVNENGNMVDYNPNYPSPTNDYVVVTNQATNQGPYKVKFDRNFMNMLNEDEDTDGGFGYSWMGWFSKNPNDSEFDVEADLLSTADEYEFYTEYSEGEGANIEEQYFPTLIEQLDDIGATLAVYAYVKYTPEMDGVERTGP